MSNMSIDYLVTFVNKSEQEIVEVIQKTNIKGNVLVGNQKCEKESTKHFLFKELSITVFNLTSIGVSRNRNFLLDKSTADYVTFLDDDLFLVDDYYTYLYADLNSLSKKMISLRYNVVSLNEERPIRQINKDGYVSLFRLRQFGVCGIFFNRLFLIENNIYFDENIGPGTKINHGEDYIFLNTFFGKDGKIYQKPNKLFYAKQDISTWQGENRDILNEIKSQGYNYRILYGVKAPLFLLIHMAKHINFYKNKKYNFISLYKVGLQGIRFRKRCEKGWNDYGEF